MMEFHYVLQYGNKIYSLSSLTGEIVYEEEIPMVGATYAVTAPVV
jgi:hypothetical protein